MDAPTLTSEHACAGGVQQFFQHESAIIGLPMRYGIFLPPQAKKGPVPAVLYLAGLTCSEDTFPSKSGAQRYAAERGLALVTPDTSPRNAHLAHEADHWDFGVAAGFYLDATEMPWSMHWKMESYLLKDLLPLLGQHHPVNLHRLGLMGHSMGGHGALTLAFRHAGKFKSLSALAPICAPTQCPWGQKAFRGYLGDSPSRWASHDATALIRARKAAHMGALYPAGILVDQGLADKHLDVQLKPELLEAACRHAGQPLTLRRHAGYDHGYYFVQSFINDHLKHHAAQL